MGTLPERGFPKSSRIVLGQDFTFVLRRGACAADGVLVVFVAPLRSPVDVEIESTPSRLGVTIPKRTGNAVVRNRWKRWIRESFRTQPSRVPAGWDIVVRPKKDATPSWNAIERSLPKLIGKAIRRAAQKSVNR